MKDCIRDGARADADFGGGLAWPTRQVKTSSVQARKRTEAWKLNDCVRDSAGADTDFGVGLPSKPGATDWTSTVMLTNMKPAILRVNRHLLPLLWSRTAVFGALPTPQ